MLDAPQTSSANAVAGTRPAIVITGAASGLGREFARLAVMEGSALVLVDRAGEQLNDLATELAVHAVQTVTECIDLTTSDAVPTIESTLAKGDLYCDVLINCAGFGLFGPAAQVAEREQMSLLDVNVRALASLTLHFLPGMVARRRGGVLNIGSITGYAPGPNMAAYYSSKAFVNSFSAALGYELAGTGVTVTCLAPGLIMTAFFDRCPEAQTWLFKLMPQSNAVEIAAAGWLGFKAGKRLIIPHWRNQLAVAIGRLLPQSLVLRIVGFLQRPR
jgi:short-subunit dehydrogenase